MLSPLSVFTTYLPTNNPVVITYVQIIYIHLLSGNRLDLIPSYL
jgi:hypothetical protein